MKKIAITQRVVVSEHGTLRDALEHEYLEYYKKFNVLLIPIPNGLKEADKFLSSLNVDGIILSGGNDISPDLYESEKYKNEKTAAKTKNESVAECRDKTEKKIIEYAMKKNIPVLGECRGMQFLNVYFGGKLITVENHVRKNHNLELTDDRLKQKQVTVNSYHNFGCKKEDLGDGLEVFAKAEDSTIEGVFHKKYPFAGIMWHPERDSPDNDFNEKLIKAFVERGLFWK